MNKQELNNWLAIHIMKWHLDKSCVAWLDKNMKIMSLVSDWNPTTNFKQIKRCIERSKYPCFIEFRFDPFRTINQWTLLKNKHRFCDTDEIEFAICMMIKEYFWY